MSKLLDPLLNKFAILMNLTFKKIINAYWYIELIKVNLKINMTKCIAKTVPSEDQSKSPEFKFSNVSQEDIAVTLNSIRRDSKSDSKCFLFKIGVNGHEAGEFTILEESNFDKIAYQGNIGAEVYPDFKGNQLAEKVLYMLLPFCKELGLSELLITTDPDNEASIKICRNLSARYLDTLQANNENTEKLRYVFSGF